MCQHQIDPYPPLSKTGKRKSGGYLIHQETRKCFFGECIADGSSQQVVITRQQAVSNLQSINRQSINRQSAVDSLYL